MKDAKFLYNPTLISYIVGGLVLVLAAILFKPFAIVNPGERGVVMQFGKVLPNVLDEGIHPIVPVVNTVKTISVKVQKSDVQSEASSKDLQDVKTLAAVNWHIDPKRVNEVYQRIGDENELLNRIIAPAVSEVVKASTARKTAEEIITQRTELKQEIDTTLKERLAAYGILVDDVSLVDISFSPEFAKAIESKQIAEQEAKRADFTALRAEKEAQAEVNRARGQAEAQRLQRQTISAELLQQQAIEKWNGQFPMVMGGSNTLPFINLNPSNLSSGSAPAAPAQ
ncbi:prohibitin family protein [Microcoleus sp. FACHB-672]|uniref:prohibitin family protein n=1 Tax=Microcoleus sp. FACHB-672 TaxID=2692825 RepID=UPI0016826B10|nr:prohibitin family protein [Microcoleus sp. FACHB-672]MBD2042439.1 prohibitin family protein [Microcoleus sp. FACHB-672]